MDALRDPKAASRPQTPASPEQDKHCPFSPWPSGCSPGNENKPERLEFAEHLLRARPLDVPALHSQTDLTGTSMAHFKGENQREGPPREGTCPKVALWVSSSSFSLTPNPNAVETGSAGKHTKSKGSPRRARGGRGGCPQGRREVVRPRPWPQRGRAVSTRDSS